MVTPESMRRIIRVTRTTITVIALLVIAGLGMLLAGVPQPAPLLTTLTAAILAFLLAWWVWWRLSQ